MTANDHLSPGQFRNPLPGQPGNENVAWMNIHKVRRHREYDRYTPGWLDRAGPGSYDKLKSGIREHGIEHPIHVEYDHENHRAVIGEGNHRIEAAYELGHTAVPVVIDPGAGQDDRFSKMTGLPEVSTPQKLFAKPGEHTRPQDVFGREYGADPHAMKIGRELRRKDDY